MTDALMMEIKRLKQENNKFTGSLFAVAPEYKSMVSVGSQTEYLASLKPLNTKQSAYIGGLELMKMRKNSKMITNAAYEYITSEFTRWYEAATFEPTIEAINEMRNNLLYIADTISILEEAGVDMDTHKDKVTDFVEDITEDALTHGNRWFNRKIDKFISKYARSG